MVNVDRLKWKLVGGKKLQEEEEGVDKQVVTGGVTQEMKRTKNFIITFF